MPVFIFEPDALDRLSAVEGKGWRELQERNRASPAGFHVWLQAWQEKAALGADYADEPVRSFVEGGDGAIYGEGGYARYVLTCDGELVLLGWSSRAEHQARARAQGFTIR